jgi:uridine kinase
MGRAKLLDYLTNRIAAMPAPPPVCIGLDGIDAAGKTTLADALAETLRSTGRQVLRASIDSFHHPRDVRYRQGADSPAGYYTDSFDLDALRRVLLDPLRQGKPIRTACFDHRRDIPVDSAPFTPASDAILLFDGIFLQRPELAGAWDWTIFVQVSFETSLARAVHRDRDLIGSEQAVRRRYETRYIPAQQAYLRAHRPAERANLVVINDRPETPQWIENAL